MPPNSGNEGNDLIAVTRDHLAGDRTVLANERTFLAYIRTALTFFVAGVSLIKFFNNNVIEIIGWIFIPVAIITLFIGIRSFKHNRAHIAHVTCHLPYPDKKDII